MIPFPSINLSQPCYKWRGIRGLHKTWSIPGNLHDYMKNCNYMNHQNRTPPPHLLNPSYVDFPKEERIYQIWGVYGPFCYIHRKTDKKANVCKFLGRGGGGLELAVVHEMQISVMHFSVMQRIAWFQIPKAIFSSCFLVRMDRTANGRRQSNFEFSRGCVAI